MPEVLTRVDEGDSMKNFTKDYKRDHLLPSLRESPEAAAGYIEASLTDNIDSPESIALAFQDVAEAYALPIDVSMKSNEDHARLQAAVVEAARRFRVTEKTADEGRNTLIRTDALINHLQVREQLRDAVDALFAFEAENKIGVE
jgi:antitoxin component of RelBE/YafQ-DinJ toxin-antitoxin module